MHDVDALLAAVEREERREPFEFRFGGKTWRVPHLADLTIGQQEDLDRHHYAVLVEAARCLNDQTGEVVGGDGRELYHLVRGLTAEQWVEAIQVPWMIHAGLLPGELPASSPSSNGTARPSTRTSRPATA